MKKKKYREALRMRTVEVFFRERGGKKKNQNCKLKQQNLSKMKQSVDKVFRKKSFK